MNDFSRKWEKWFHACVPLIAYFLCNDQWIFQIFEIKVKETTKFCSTNGHCQILVAFWATWRQNFDNFLLGHTVDRFRIVTETLQTQSASITGSAWYPSINLKILHTKTNRQTNKHPNKQTNNKHPHRPWYDFCFCIYVCTTIRNIGCKAYLAAKLILFLSYWNVPIFSCGQFCAKNSEIVGVELSSMVLVVSLNEELKHKISKLHLQYLRFTLKWL